MRKTKRFCILLVTWLCLICTPESVSAEMHISPNQAILMKGERLALKLKEADGYPIWACSEGNVVTITNQGVVTAENKGRAMISAELHNEKCFSTVRVDTPKLNCTTLQLKSGDKYRLKVSGTNAKVNWSSSNKKIAKITSNGTVKAVSNGVVKITAKINTKKLVCKVTVIKETHPASQQITVEVGKTENFSTFTIPGGLKKAKWSSGNRKIAKVSSKGVVTGVSAGDTKIYALVGTIKNVFDVHVEEPHNFSHNNTGAPGSYLSENREWTYDTSYHKVAVLKKYVGHKAKVKVPKEIDNYPVAYLDAGLFSYTDVKEVSFENNPLYQNTTQRIPENCFAFCKNLRKVTLPKNTTTIGYLAFEDCTKLKSITVPNSLTTLEIIPDPLMDPFFASGLKTITLPKDFKQSGFCENYYIESIEAVNVEKGNPCYYSKDGVVYSKKTHALVCYPYGKRNKSFKVPDGTPSISDDVFINNFLKSISLPKGCKFTEVMSVGRQLKITYRD